MVIANPRVHIICGVCGKKDMMKFKIEDVEVEKSYDDSSLIEKTVCILTCENCSTLTYLNELLEESETK